MWSEMMQWIQMNVFEQPAVLTIACLVLVGLISLATVVVQKQHFVISWHTLRRGTSLLLWASPVLVVLGLVGVEVAAYLQPAKAVAAPTEIEPGDGPLFTEADVYTTPEPFASVPDDERHSEVTAAPEWYDSRAWKYVEPDRRRNPQVSWRFCLQSAESVTLEEARAEAARQAIRFAGQAMQESGYQIGHLAGTDNWQIAKQLLIREAVQTVHYELSNGHEYDMYKVWWQVQLTPDSRQALLSQWKQDVGPERGQLVIGLFALMTVLAASVMTCLRLNARSNGQHWLRLRLAALSFMVAAGLGFLQFVRTLG